MTNHQPSLDQMKFSTTVGSNLRQAAHFFVARFSASIFLPRRASAARRASSSIPSVALSIRRSSEGARGAIRFGFRLKSSAGGFCSIFMRPIAEKPRKPFTRLIISPVSCWICKAEKPSQAIISVAGLNGSSSCRRRGHIMRSGRDEAPIAGPTISSRIAAMRD